MAGSPEPVGDCPFSDITPGAYYEKALTWAAANNIANGYEQNRFGTDDEMTREQLIAVFCRYADYKGIDLTANSDLNLFTDSGEVSDWAADNIKQAVDLGLIKGNSDGSLNPQGNASRSQFAAMLHRFTEHF